MMAKWELLSRWHRFGLMVGVMLVCLLGFQLVMWRGMNHSLEELQNEVARLDRESEGLIQKTASLKALEMDIKALRENLAARVQQFPAHIESKVFRRDVMKMAKRRSVTVQMWKPEGSLTGIQNSEASIPIAVKIEGNFQGTVQFLDDLRQLTWVERIPSIVMAGRPEKDDSSLIITNLVIHGITTLGIQHVEQLLKA